MEIGWSISIELLLLVRISGMLLHSLSPHYPFLLHNQCMLTSLMFQLCTPEPPAIPDTNTLYYNSRNIPKHTQGPQNLASLILLPPIPPFHFSATLPTMKVSISSQTTIATPTPNVYRYYHQGVLHVIGKQLVWHWNCEFGITNLHLQSRDRNSTTN
jgi:hypothetical protein